MFLLCFVQPFHILEASKRSDEVRSVYDIVRAQSLQLLVPGPAAAVTSHLSFLCASSVSSRLCKP